MKKHLFFIVLLLLKLTLLFSQGGTRSAWLNSQLPNYNTNENLQYPYSNQEYFSYGTIVNPIPSSDSYIPLIDFYGEGRIVDNNVVSGFKNAYNINHQYQLVSKGPDRGRKIPNRIPVSSYNDDLGLSNYVQNDRVTTITLMGAPIQKNTAQEMARMIRKDGLGRIIVYGFSKMSLEVAILELELKKIGFHEVSYNYVLEPPFSEINGFSGRPRVYKSKKIKVAGEKVFYSLNPKTNLGSTQRDMVTLDYSSLLALNADLSGGIKGTIDKPGGKITVEVYAYDPFEYDGIQKIYLKEGDYRAKLVYKAYSDITNSNDYVEKITTVPYGFDKNSDGSYRVLGTTNSNNVKLLGGNSRSGWEINLCENPLFRGVVWLAWNIGAIYDYGKFRDQTAPCRDVITNLKTGRQPILIKVTIKDATLYDIKIPGVADNIEQDFIDGTEELQEYKIIKKLKVTVLEAPEDSREGTFYKEQIGNYIKEMNKYYTAKTGNIKNAAITAEIGNARILFQKVDLIIKKATAERYNYQVQSQMDAYENEAGVNSNDAETMQLIYIHSLVRFYPPAAPSERVIRGVSSNGGAIISDNDYTIFSYSRMFNDAVAVYGSPGSTLAHEFGHYFDLDHPFDGGCAQAGGGDLVADTPPAEGALWYLRDPGGLNERGIDNPCQNPTMCNGVRRQIENIMDYGPCRWLFTKGQVERMIHRINTKPNLFVIAHVYDGSVDPDKIDIHVIDQRIDKHPRRKRSIANDEFSIRMLYPNSQIGYYNLEIISDISEKATIRISDIYANQVYKKRISVEKGQNYFPIKSHFFQKNELYLLTYISDEGRAEKIKFLRSQ